MRRSGPDKPQSLTDALLRRWSVPAPETEGSKEGRGRCVIIAGAVEMPGAAILSSTAALRAGAGKVRLATPAPVAMAVATSVPELFVISIEGKDGRDQSLRAVLDSAQHADAVLIGPGMRNADAIRWLLPRLLCIESLRGLVIDATALATAGDHLGSAAVPVIITPHAGEMAAVLRIDPREIDADAVGVARTAARRFRCVVVLKRAKTIICSADGPVYLNTRGNVGLATAGSGDVLAGLITGLLARGCTPVHAAAVAVAVHARAGERLAKRFGPVGYLARDIPAEAPAILAGIRG